MAFNVRQIFAALDQAHARYVVVGGFAVILHGYTRFTHDLDLVIDLAPENCEKALKALETAGLKPRLPVSMRDFAKPEVREDWYRNRRMQVFQLWDPHNEQRSVDIFVHEPVKFDELWRDSVVKDYDGVAIRIAAIPHLIAMKTEAGRPRDREDIAKLQEIQRYAENRSGGKNER
jgi:hypothetical protein